MDNFGNKCTAGLVAVSIAVLIVNYGLLPTDAFSINLGWLSIDGQKFRSSLFVPVATFALLTGLCTCHIFHRWQSICDCFANGYRESKAIVELVQRTVAAAAESPKYGSPRGGINGSLFYRTFPLGQFQKPSGALSEGVMVVPSAEEHYQAVLSGVVATFCFKLWPTVYLPIVLAAWGIGSVAV